MPRRPHPRPLARPRRGLTLIELLIAMIVGLLVLTSATSILSASFGNLTGVRLREGVSRDARFLGMSFERDLAETGVDLESGLAFGSIAVRGDTLTILSVPYEPTAPLEYFVAPNLTAAAPAAGQGTCGARCLNLRNNPSGVRPVLSPGDLVLLTSLGSRRLATVATVPMAGDSTPITIHARDSLLFRPANMTALALQLSPTAAFVQRLRPVVYWRQGTDLMRAERFTPGGALDGVVVAQNVRSFTVRIIFTDGGEAASANVTDADLTNDYDDIVGVRVNVQLETARAHRAVNGGALRRTDYEWVFAPRNLTYERNRGL